MHLFVHACIQNEGEQEYKNCELDKNQVGQRSRSSGHTHVGWARLFLQMFFLVLAIAVVLSSTVPPRHAEVTIEQ